MEKVMTSVPRPDKMPRWATSDVVSPITGVNNVVEPSESKKNVGWQTFEPPARQFFNFLGRLTYQWILYLDDRTTNRNNTTDGAGDLLVTQENVMVTLNAIDKVTPANYIHAVGYRGTGAATFNTLNNNVLTIGALGVDGSVEIAGGSASNIIVHVSMQKV